VSHLGFPIVKRMLLLAEMISAPELLKQGYLFNICEAKDLDQEVLVLAQAPFCLSPNHAKINQTDVGKTNCQSSKRLSGFNS
jgi:enoyl-CoA hydratase